MRIFDETKLNIEFEGESIMQSGHDKQVKSLRTQEDEPKPSEDPDPDHGPVEPGPPPTDQKDPQPGPPPTEPKDPPQPQ